MDNEKLGEPLTLEDSKFYQIKREYSKAAYEEAERAREFLSKPSSKTGTSLYDHLRDVITEVIRLKIEDAVDILEEISQKVKADSIVRKISPLPDTEKDDYYASIRQFCESFAILQWDVIPDIKGPDEDDDDDDGTTEKVEVQEAQAAPDAPEANAQAISDVPEEKAEDIPKTKAIPKAEVQAIPEAEPVQSWIPKDLHDIDYHMFRFRQTGVGLSLKEAFMINLSLKALAVQFKLDDVRFWGKIFGTNGCYFIAEAPYSEIVIEQPPEVKPDEIIQDTQNQEVPPAQPEQQEEKKPEEAEKSPEEKSEPEVTNPDAEQPKEPAFIIPPIPVPQVKPIQRYAEKNGEGVNKYMYFATNNLLQPWTCLPQLNSNHIVDARNIKILFTGDLNAEVKGCTQFEGKESHYLRAQIARITASTYIAPVGYYRIKKEEIPVAIVPEKKPGKAGKGGKSAPPPPPPPPPPKEEMDEIEENPEYQRKSANEHFNMGLAGLAHIRQDILKQGYCMWKEVVDENAQGVGETTAGKLPNEPEKKDQDGQDTTKPVEDKGTPVPILKTIDEDQGDHGNSPWTLRQSSYLMAESSLLLARSNIWPGAYMYYDGKGFENIYIGEGYKYTTLHYAPKLGQQWQEEYKVDETLTEPVDVWVENPVPPPPPEENPENKEATDEMSKEQASTETTDEMPKEQTSTETTDEMLKEQTSAETTDEMPKEQTSTETEQSKESQETANE